MTNLFLHRVFLTELSSSVNPRRSARLLAKRLSSSNQSEELLAGSHKPHQSVKEGVPSADSLHQQTSCCSTSVLSKEETSTSGSVSKRQKTSSSSSSLSKPTHQQSSRKGTSSSRLREESEGEGGKRKRIKLSSSEGIAKPITDSSPVSESKSRKSNRRETEEDQSDSDIEDKSKRQKIKRKESSRSSKGSKGKQHINKSTELKYVNVHVLLHNLTLYPMCVYVYQFCYT